MFIIIIIINGENSCVETTDTFSFQYFCLNMMHFSGFFDEQ